MTNRRSGVCFASTCALLGMVLAACSPDEQPAPRAVVRTSTVGSVTISGKVTTSSGVALARQHVVIGSLSTDTASDGSYAIDVVPGTLTVQVSPTIGPTFPTGLVDAEGSPINSNLSYSISRQLAVTAATTLDITIPTCVIRGVVQDPNGLPLPGTLVATGDWSTNKTLPDGSPDPWTWASVSQGTTTDASGRFYLVVVIGAGSLYLNPPSGFGLTTYRTYRSAPNDLDVTIKFPPPVALTGTVTTADGLAVVGATVSVQSVTSQTDSSGKYALSVVPSQLSVTLQASTPIQIPTGLVAANGSAITSSMGFYSSKSLTVMSATTLDVTMASRVVSGVVRRADGAAVAGATVSVVHWSTITSSESWYASLQSASTTSDSTGHYRLYVLSGSGTLRATAPTGSGLPGVQVEAVATADATLDVAFPAAATVSGKVTMSDGTPLPEQRVSIGLASTQTDTSGRYTMAAALGDSSMYVDAGKAVVIVTGLTSTGTPGGTPVYSNFSYGMSRLLSLSGDLTVDVTVPTRTLFGTIRDPDGHPVASTNLAHNSKAPMNLGSASPWSGNLATSDTRSNNRGEYRFVLAPASSTIVVRPPTASGLALVNLPFSMTDDLQMDITLQFPQNQASSTLPAGGGTVSTDTGSGASTADPVTTRVVSHDSGAVSITEGPIDLQTTTPPGSYSFLTQEIQISAPDASGAPLELTFTLDASRIPTGPSGNIKMSRNGALVGPCTGASRIASPDPCEVSRGSVGDGDLQITVLANHASRWHFAYDAGNTGSGGAGGAGGTGGAGSGGSGGAGGAGGGGVEGAGSGGNTGAGGGAGSLALGGTTGSAGTSGAAGSGGTTVVSSSGGNSGGAGGLAGGGSSGAGSVAGATGVTGSEGNADGGDTLDAGGAFDAGTHDTDSAVDGADAQIDLAKDTSLESATLDTDRVVIDAARAPDLGPADARDAADSGTAILIDAPKAGADVPPLLDGTSTLDGSAGARLDARGGDTAAGAAAENGDSGCGCALGARPRPLRPLAAVFLASALWLVVRRRPGSRRGGKGSTQLTAHRQGLGRAVRGDWSLPK